MATKHGNRVYIQVLLEAFRGELFIEKAATLGIKPSALIRELVYEYLASVANENTYAEAKHNDEQKWQEAVEARLQGRLRSRLAKAAQSEQATDASSSPM
jgi:hypothetical protein|tara:strand:- start:200 stop:499 length:300 start_codon:yes stop_codon:yes gene_type:complete